MKSVSTLLVLTGLTIFASAAQADAVYTCKNNRGDSLRLTFTREGKRMAVKSRYAGLTLRQQKHSPADPSGYTMFQGNYPGGVAHVAVQSNLVRGDESSNGVIGSITFESDDFDCKAGTGKLRVSRKTRQEFSPDGQGEPCKLTSYYEGMTFIPPRIVCNYGGMRVIHGTGGIL